MKYFWSLSLLLVVFTSCKNNSHQQQKSSNLVEDTSEIPNSKTDHQLRQVTKATITPELDGLATDPAWQDVAWQPLNQKWLGEDYTAADFSGRYKLTWTPEALYIIAEITDDVIYDKEKDPLTLWWDDDCLEIFIDADNSGGGHQFTHNAFAYHVALDGNVVDVAPGQVPTLYNNHVKSKIVKTGENTMIWECKMTIYNDTYKDGGVNEPKILDVHQKLGFALAYCDNDTSAERENFIGSVAVPGEDKNRGWIDAGIFGTIELVE
ncbi:sugar-binding protein [Dokdonia sp. R86516]|uniref:sugar-binding protein n=1 Tax=Dokdonia sp. R86516 TaxID=3093856 RepID=UPI0037C906A6